MKKVICSGTTQKSYFKCEEKKCQHRKLHNPIKGRCNCRKHNGEDGWCVAPGTVSLLDGDEDGGLVTCMTPNELRKKQKELREYMLKEILNVKEQVEKDIQIKKDSLKIINKKIKIIKGQK